jgi:hypothetical protein
MISVSPQTRFIAATLIGQMMTRLSLAGNFLFLNCTRHVLLTFCNSSDVFHWSSYGQDLGLVSLPLTMSCYMQLSQQLIDHQLKKALGPVQLVQA